MPDIFWSTKALTKPFSASPPTGTGGVGTVCCPGLDPIVGWFDGASTGRPPTSSGRFPNSPTCCLIASFALPRMDVVPTSLTGGTSRCIMCFRGMKSGSRLPTHLAKSSGEPANPLLDNSLSISIFGLSWNSFRTADRTCSVTANCRVPCNANSLLR